MTASQTSNMSKHITGIIARELGGDPAGIGSCIETMILDPLTSALDQLGLSLDEQHIIEKYARLAGEAAANTARELREKSPLQHIDTVMAALENRTRVSDMDRDPQTSYSRSALLRTARAELREHEAWWRRKVILEIQKNLTSHNKNFHDPEKATNYSTYVNASWLGISIVNNVSADFAATLLRDLSVEFTDQMRRPENSKEGWYILVGDPDNGRGVPTSIPDVTATGEYWLYSPGQSNIFGLAKNRLEDCAGVRLIFGGQAARRVYDSPPLPPLEENS